MNISAHTDISEFFRLTMLNFLNVIILYYYIKDLSVGFGGSAILEQI